MNFKFKIKFLDVKSKLTQLISYRLMNHRNDHKKQHTFLHIPEIKHHWNSGIIDSLANRSIGSRSSINSTRLTNAKPCRTAINHILPPTWFSFQLLPTPLWSHLLVTSPVESVSDLFLFFLSFVLMKKI